MKLSGASATIPLLTRKRGFSYELPNGVPPRPAQLAGSIIYAAAPRLITFGHSTDGGSLQIPAQYNPQRFRSPQGIQGVMYSVRQSPAMVVAIWQLRGGRLWTFMPDKDLGYPSEPAPGREGLEEVIQHLTVSYLRGYPLLSGTGPVSTGGTGDIQEQASTFFEPARYGDWPVVRFCEDERIGPSSPGDSDVRQLASPAAEPGEWGEFWALTAHGVRVICLGPLEVADELRSVTAAIARSVTPLD